MKFVATIGALIRGRLLRVEVCGDSMEPGLRHGDRVLVHRLAEVEVGAVVLAEVAVWADEPELVIKRVTAVHSGQVTLGSDNPASGRDSRHFGPIPLAQVIGLVLRAGAAGEGAPAKGRVRRRP